MDIINFIRQVPETKQKLKNLYQKGEIKINPFDHPKQLVSILRDNPGIRMIYYEWALVSDYNDKDIAEYIFFKFPDVELLMISYKHQVFYRDKLSFEEKYKNVKIKNLRAKDLDLLICLDPPLCYELTDNLKMRDLYWHIERYLDQKVVLYKDRVPITKKDKTYGLDHLHTLLRKFKFTDEYFCVNGYGSVFEEYTFRDLEEKYNELPYVLKEIDHKDFEKYVKGLEIPMNVSFDIIKDMSKLLLYGSLDITYYLRRAREKEKECSNKKEPKESLRSSINNYRHPIALSRYVEARL